MAIKLESYKIRNLHILYILCVFEIGYVACPDEVHILLFNVNIMYRTVYICWDALQKPNCLQKP